MHTSNTLAKSYDELPYIFQADPRTYPGKNAVLGLLYGMEPVDLSEAKILELGCAQGANIIPIAERFPNAHIVGVDLSTTHIQEAEKMSRFLGLNNIRFICGDFRSMDLPNSYFDYIIVHGLFSWVSKDIQSDIMSICKRYLSPQGIAHISFNNAPGWSVRLALRQYLQDFTENIPSHQQKTEAAYNFLESLTKVPELGQKRFAKFLGEDIHSILKQKKEYLGHDFLEEDNNPCSYKDFSNLAKLHHLQILGEAQLRRNILNQVDVSLHAFYKEVGQTEDSWNQLYDFINFRMFRNTLLCHRHISLSEQPVSSVFDKIYFSSALRLEKEPLDLNPNVFSNFIGQASMQVSSPIEKCILLALQSVYPNNISLKGILEYTLPLLEKHGYVFNPEDILDITAFLFYGYTKNQIDFWSHSLNLQCQKKIAPKPLTNNFIRYLSKHTQYPIINAHHETVNLSQKQKALMCLLDGTHSIDALQKALKWSKKDIITFLEKLTYHAMLSEDIYSNN